MNPGNITRRTPVLAVEVPEKLNAADLEQLCRATRDTALDGEDSSFAGTPSEMRLAAFWKGVLLAPHRTLLIGRLDGVVAGAAQLARPSPMSESGPYVASIQNFFVAPWARGFGLARMIVEGIEVEARAAGIRILDISMRAGRARAVAIFDGLGYVRWAEKEHYAFVDGKFVNGIFYYKQLTEEPA